MRKDFLPPSPALRERRHRGLATLSIAARRPAVLMLPEGERPHPGRANWRGVHLHDAANDSAVGEHVEIVVIPLAGTCYSAPNTCFEEPLSRLHLGQDQPQHVI